MSIRGQDRSHVERNGGHSRWGGRSLASASPRASTLIGRATVLRLFREGSTVPVVGQDRPCSGGWVGDVGQQSASAHRCGSDRLTAGSGCSCSRVGVDAVQSRSKPPAEDGCVGLAGRQIALAHRCGSDMPFAMARPQAVQEEALILPMRGRDHPQAGRASHRGSGLDRESALWSAKAFIFRSAR